MAKKITPQFIDDAMTTDLELDAASVLDRNRDNHTGTQLSSTISDFNTAAQNALSSQLSGKVSYSDMQKTSLYYVSPSGNDSTGDGSYAKPFQTIAHAISASGDGDTIFLFSGLYTESQITIPASTGSRSFRSFSSATTEVQNGFTHTASVGNVGFSFDSINLNSLTINESLATNGLISLTKCTFRFTRTDSNQNVLCTSTEGTIPDGTVSGGSNTFNECLFISNITLNGGSTIFENCKFVAPVLANGQSTARMLGCSLFGATEFIIGAISGGHTPVWEVDLSTEYLGGYLGSITKTLLSNVQELGFTPEDVANKSNDVNLGNSTTLYPTQNAAKAYVDTQVSGLTTTDIDLDTRIQSIEKSQLDTKEPTGFVNRTDSIVSFDNNTLTLSIAPVSSSFDIYIKGTKQNIVNTLQKTIPNTSGNYFFYIDQSGQLDYMSTFDVSLLSDYAYCAYVYYSATDGKAVSVGEERHGITMDASTHGYLHTTRGTQLVSGASISYTLGTGNVNSSGQISLGDMQIKDEDITANITNSATPSANFEQVLSPVAEIPILYRQGASEWRKQGATRYPIWLATNRCYYNENVGGVWQLTEAPANNRVCVSYIFATTDIIEPVICILGQAQYQNIDEARLNAAWDQISFGDLPAQELKLLYVVYYETSSNFSNEVKSKIVYVGDVRFNFDRQVSATVFNGNHSNLSGLGNDDHLQYHNDTRGDLRYYLKAEVDSAISTSSTNDRDRSNHTGTQLASTISDFTSAVQGVTINAANIDGGVVSNEEFATLDGITTGTTIQTQLNGKQATITGGASTITSSDLTINRALVSDASGKVAISATSSTELGYVSGVTSAIQTQLNAKANLSGGNTFTGKQVVTPTATTSGLNIGSVSSDPTTLANADIWYNSTSNDVKFQKNGVSITNLNILAIRTLTTGTTYTPTAGTKYIDAILVGGGAGGGGVSGAGTSVGVAGGGGGGAVLRIFTALTGAASYTIAIGTGGAGGTAGANNGSNGTATTLSIGASTYSAQNGNGGTGQTAGTAAANVSGGSGGTLPTGGTLNIAGQAGHGGLRVSGVAGLTGRGADSMFGSGGLAPVTAAAGNNATGFGAGGSGAYSTAATNRAGGNGSPGVIVITEYA